MFGEHTAALLSAVGSMISLILVILFIPEFKKQSTDSKSVLNLQKILGLLTLPKVCRFLTNNGTIYVVYFKICLINILLLSHSLYQVGSLMLVRTVCGIPIGIIQSMFSVLAMEQFQLSADQSGMLLSYVGALSMIMQVL